MKTKCSEVKLYERLICLSRSKWPHSIEINSKFCWHFFLSCVCVCFCMVLVFRFSFSFTWPFLCFGDRNSRYLHIMKHVACVFVMIACDDWPRWLGKLWLGVRSFSEHRSHRNNFFRLVFVVLEIFYFIHFLVVSFIWTGKKNKTDHILSRAWWWNGLDACSMNSI